MIVHSARSTLLIRLALALFVPNRSAGRMIFVLPNKPNQPRFQAKKASFLPKSRTNPPKAKLKPTPTANASATRCNPMQQHNAIAFSPPPASHQFQGFLPYTHPHRRE